MTFTIHAPQIIYASLFLLSAAQVVIEHGKPRKNYNAWTFLLIDSPITLGLLYWGGFFGGK